MDGTSADHPSSDALSVCFFGREPGYKEGMPLIILAPRRLLSLATRLCQAIGMLPRMLSKTHACMPCLAQLPDSPALHSLSCRRNACSPHFATPTTKYEYGAGYGAR